MRNKWYHRFQLFDMNMILYTTQFSDTRMVHNTIHNLCYVVSEKYADVGSVINNQNICKLTHCFETNQWTTKLIQ